MSGISEGVWVAIVGGLGAVCTLLFTKSKCMYTEHNGCRLGFMDSSISPDPFEFKVIKINNVELLYLYRKPEDDDEDT